MAQPSPLSGPATPARPPLTTTQAPQNAGLLQAYLLARETLRRVKPSATPCFAVDADERRRRQRPAGQA